MCCLDDSQDKRHADSLVATQPKKRPLSNTVESLCFESYRVAQKETETDDYMKLHMIVANSSRLA